ncbi:MAG: riboflavin synthase [Desulfobacterales bacterium]|nr:riboflavin synthase [Desulfobacterales bacterium]
MFTGIIEGFGKIADIRPASQGKVLTIDTEFDLEGTRIGDSIAANGACLTAVTIDSRRFSADVSPESLDKTTFGKAKIGDRVNLERALRLSDRIDGHLVSGHIDGVGTITGKKNAGNAVVVTVKVPEDLFRYMIVKGSVAVDGISLTINRCETNIFEVSIIPHTAKLTTIGFKDVGRDVNIETDLIGKYVERFVTGKRGVSIKASGVDMALLAKSGFL